jgi:hypothetical protein
VSHEEGGEGKGGEEIEMGRDRDGNGNRYLSSQQIQMTTYDRET